ncbi:hypothetical protein EG328_007027 [Venturia inaequalis]|uniref:Uncharacterized protein n=1 Tax=Venturia inaequalis TaxID=5025 RepID=A0A8H3YQA0_VENIN|nr:hypothetical protein EG328_007027 [Venturia inaequalis]
MTFQRGQSNQQPQRSKARNHHRSNMQLQAHHSGKHNGGFQPINNSPNNNHRGANTNSIGSPYHQMMNSNAVRGSEQYGSMNGTLNGNMYGDYQGQPFTSQHNPIMQQQFLPFQQGQFPYNAPELTPLQLAHKKFKAEEPLRNAVASYRAQQMYERTQVWDQHFRKLLQLWKSPEYRAKNQHVEKTMEDWQNEEKRDWPRFKLAALEKDNEERHAAIERLEAANKEEREAAVKEGRKPAVKKVKRSHLPVYSERETEYEELFGDHHSIFTLNDVLYASAPRFNVPISRSPPAVQPSAGPAQDTVKRVVKRGREDDVVDEHIVKRSRPAGIDTSPVPSAKVEPQQLPDTIDTTQKKLAEENPKGILKRGREEDVEEERDIKRTRQEAIISTIPQTLTEDITSSCANKDVISDSLQALSTPDINTPRGETASLPVNDGASSTKIETSSSDHVVLAQSSTSPTSLQSPSPSSTPSAPAVSHIMPATTDTSPTSPVVTSLYSSPTSTHSPGLSSDASPYSPASPHSSTGSAATIPSNNKRNRHSDDESDEAPPIKRQYIRATSLKSPPGLATAITRTSATDIKVVNASSSALSASIPASSFYDSALDDDEEEL